MRENIEAGAADLMDWMRRYEAGEGSEAELGEILHNIEAADGWNLQPRIAAQASHLGAPPLDALVGAAVRRGEAPRGAVPGAGRRNPTSCCWTSRPTISTPSPSAGSRNSCASFPAR